MATKKTRGKKSRAGLDFEEIIKERETWVLEVDRSTVNVLDIHDRCRSSYQSSAEDMGGMSKGCSKKQILKHEKGSGQEETFGANT
ncbi:unnamed protein product, partial [Dovyalis caffra]